MNKPLVDIIITTYPKTEVRRDIAEASFKSLFNNTDTSCVRLTLVLDGPGDGLIKSIAPFQCADHVLLHKENLGLAPSLNQALCHVDTLNRYHEQRDEKDMVSEFICYVQDDVIYKRGWLDTMVKYFMLFEDHKKIGFATGHDAPEHDGSTREVIGEFAGQKVLTKDWVRATNLFARRSYWMSMFPIHGMDPETGRRRARPNDGVGSGVDWWFLRNHENSVCKSGKTCLVLPGLISHLGYGDSTWLNRSLPEKDSDYMDDYLVDIFPGGR